jgi:hypothetical protein
MRACVRVSVRRRACARARLCSCVCRHALSPAANTLGAAGDPLSAPQNPLLTYAARRTPDGGYAPVRAMQLATAAMHCDLGRLHTCGQSAPVIDAIVGQARGYSVVVLAAGRA